MNTHDGLISLSDWRITTEHTILVENGIWVLDLPNDGLLVIASVLRHLRCALY